ncbi:E3 ubiquitin-protein ligase TRIP12-like [Harmonia axyridis]|uniref:E3 ubiquitin-protein ligase TRIP12-like n=1 Tax=Harmonia axyridis TaxID=115357 RepID=UPI001E27914F|nr:E3 ubiquitin-protein ligase TRIP12-like [Harmonia axyridis]
MRVFLDVFFGIPVRPQGQEFNFNSLLFKAMVKKLGYYLVDHEDKDFKNFEEIFRIGINTFGKIGAQVIPILVRCSPPNRDVELNVRPFMTIQYLLHFMFSNSYLYSYNGWCHHPNKRFATKSVLSFNGIVLSPQMTIYEVIRKYAIIGNVLGASNQKYVFLYRQYEAPLPSNEENNLDLIEEFMKPTYVLENYLQPRSSECEELREEVKNALHLSNILYGINKHWTSAYQHIQHQNVLIDPEYFTNEHLTNSVFNRLLDPFAALIGKYPPWIKYIVDNCPFVFPLRMRTFVFKVLSLDRIRALVNIIGKYSKYRSAVYIYERHTWPLMVDRNNLVNDVKEYMLHTSPSSFWNVTFKNEIGAGKGLKKELFNSIGKELQKDKYNIWTSTEETLNGFVQFNEGLYPKLDFCSHLDFYDESSSNGADLFITIGALLAKALMEWNLLELPLATPIFKYLLNKQCLNFDDLKYVHPAVHKVLGYIRQLITEREKILDDNELTDSEKSSLIKDLTINGDSLESYNLNFVLPGHEGIELIPDGANTSVDIMNAHVYVDAIMKKLFVGVQKQMSALKWGFDHVIKLSKLNMFEPEELQHIIFGEEDDSSYWSYENLIKYVQLEDCTVDDIEIQDLFGILSSAKKETRRNFLEFVSGCSRLPMGGFAVLSPPLTIYIYEGYPAAHTCSRRFNLKRGMVHCELKKFIEDIIPESLNYFGLV